MDWEPYSALSIPNPIKLVSSTMPVYLEKVQILPFPDIFRHPIGANIPPELLGFLRDNFQFITGIIGGASLAYVVVKDLLKRHENKKRRAKHFRDTFWPWFLKETTVSDKEIDQIIKKNRDDVRRQTRDGLKVTASLVKKALSKSDSEIHHVSAIFRTRLQDEDSVSRAIIDSASKGQRISNQFLYIEAYPTVLQNMCYLEMTKYKTDVLKNEEHLPEFIEVIGKMPGKREPYIWQNPRFDYLRRCCNYLLSLRELDKLKKIPSVGRFLHIVPYVNQYASLRATVSNDFCIFQTFRKCFPGTVGWPVEVHTKPYENSLLSLSVMEPERYIAAAMTEIKDLEPQYDKEIKKPVNYIRGIMPEIIEIIEKTERDYNQKLPRTRKFVERAPSGRIERMAMEMDIGNEDQNNVVHELLKAALETMLT